MAGRRLKLRYPATCAVCSSELPPGTEAWWSPDAKQASCLVCHEEPAPAGARSEPTAGRSAQREHDKREDARQARVKDRFPRMGPLLLRVAGEPQSSKAWASGAAGERLVGERLQALAEEGVITLHDRRRHGTRANIDHIAIAPSGIYVVDAKHYQGRIERREVGGWLRTDERLYVAGRDRTGLVEGVIEQTAVVRAALGEEHRSVPIWSILCFVNPNVGMFTRPFVVRGVGVTWPRALQKEVAAPGPAAAETVATIAEVLDRALRPA